MVKSAVLKFGFFWIVCATIGAIYSMETTDWANYTAEIKNFGKIVAYFGLNDYKTEVSSFGVTTTQDYKYSWCDMSSDNEEAMDRCNKITAAQVASKIASASGLFTSVLLLPLLLDIVNTSQSRFGKFIKRLAILSSWCSTFAIAVTMGLFLDLMRIMKNELENSLIVADGKEQLGHSFITESIAFTCAFIGTVCIASSRSDKK